ncbi:helix-turn-helix domain-containing protein [Caballeronia sp. LZ008]|jgi:AraC family transcriptional activator of pobA|uniref:helix-turn-helix domain-containing protein n=1 Tax=unclassified Caballeronia TaxID=2646786 RepID=UPI00202781CE|nr:MULTISPECIES: helix-turn-helix domain-containing protein [unclassified Caballeronia]MDR5767435.1 helix-turn-helix domain-containing protein [Caballeronia sp. LZ028]MDR5795959.1 helix-turn-helix domain-containing protein [Caballeronia sp. LZ008]
MRKIPNYNLYGESARPPWYDAFNFEWIVERSAPNDWHIDAHRHDALLQFLYIRGGGGQVLIENSMIDLVPPCVIMLPAQTVHGFNFAPNVDGLVVTVAQRSIEALASIAAPGLVPVLQRAGVSRMSAHSVKESAFVPIVELLEKEFRATNRGHMAAGMSLLIALFVHVVRLCESASAPSVASTERRAQQIKRFRELVAAHFREHRPVEFYAQKLGMTVTQLGRICREEISSSPLAMINEHLVREAQRDLVYSSMSVKQIAHGLGFADIAYFSRYFRKQTGVTPTQFQAEAHKALAIQ